MNKPFLLASLAAIALIPAMASAESGCRNDDHRAIGTIVGAGLGALFGNAVSEHGGKPGGTIIGGIGGGIAGNLIAGSGQKCGQNRYGYYDSNGRWVPNTRNAEGYYDANGQWVTSARNTDGYYDSNGRWVSAGNVPPSNLNRDGYYDADGRWVANNAYRQPRAAPTYGEDAVYADRDRRDGRTVETRDQEIWLDRRIHDEMDRGSLDYQDGRRALRDLSDIRRLDQQYRSADGRLDGDQSRYINDRLTQLRRQVGTSQDQTDSDRSY